MPTRWRKPFDSVPIRRSATGSRLQLAIAPDAAATRLAAIEALHLADVAQVVLHRHVDVERDALGEVADRGPGRAAGRAPCRSRRCAPGRGSAGRRRRGYAWWCSCRRRWVRGSRRSRRGATSNDTSSMAVKAPKRLVSRSAEIMARSASIGGGAAAPVAAPHPSRGAAVGSNCVGRRPFARDHCRLECRHVSRRMERRVPRRSH